MEGFGDIVFYSSVNLLSIGEFTCVDAKLLSFLSRLSS